MAIHFTCPQCGAETNVDESYAGQTGPCRSCGAMITVPAFSTGTIPAAPAARPASSSTTVIIVVLVAAVVGLFVCTGILLALLLPAVQAAREAARRSQCSNNMKQIGIALHVYHDTYGSFPPAYLADDQGRPMHSWRVLILPYLEEQALYNQYRFDEPWDGPNNRQLAARIPGVFRCPSDPASTAQTSTNYVAVTGPGTAFPGSSSTSFRDIRDGVANTLVVVETSGGNVDWMEPADVSLPLTLNPGGQGGMSSYHPGGAGALTADGAVRFIPAGIDPQVLQNMATIDGGEAVEVP